VVRRNGAAHGEEVVDMTRGISVLAEAAWALPAPCVAGNVR